MFSIFFILTLFLSLMALVVYLWVRERRYLKKKASEAMSTRVWKDVVAEREAALKKRRHFRQALEQAKKVPSP